jgi:hypothetical protein
MNIAVEERKSVWFLLPIVLLALLLTMLAILIGIATHDDGFAVEPEYYQKASAWDELQVARASSERLGWSSEASLTPSANGSLLSLALVDRSGVPVTGARVEVVAFHNARAADVEPAALSEVGDGRYQVTLGFRRPGLYEVRITATGSHGERYLETRRLDRIGVAP